MVLGFIFIINFLNYTIERIFLQKTYVITDLYYYYPDQITPDPDSPLNLGTLNSNFIIELDYYPVSTWEWAWIRWDDSNHGVWSSSYDKGNNIGITNVGYNKWVHLTYKYENGTVTMTADTQKDISYVIDKELPFAVDLYSNRYGTIYQNFKLKLL